MTTERRTIDWHDKPSLVPEPYKTEYVSCILIPGAILPLP